MSSHSQATPAYHMRAAAPPDYCLQEHHLPCLQQNTPMPEAATTGTISCLDPSQLVCRTQLPAAPRPRLTLATTAGHSGPAQPPACLRPAAGLLSQAPCSAAVTIPPGGLAPAQHRPRQPGAAGCRGRATAASSGCGSPFPVQPAWARPRHAAAGSLLTGR